MNLKPAIACARTAILIAGAMALHMTARGEEAAAGGQSIKIAPGLPEWNTRGAKSEWSAVGGVSIDPADEKRFASSPGEGVLLNGPNGKTANLFSNLVHGDCELHIEFTVPKGSNSGVYFMSHYEIQVFDSFGAAKVEHSDCGGIYQRYDEAGKRGYEGHPPKTNASRAPGKWQSFDVIFRAPRFDASGKKTANAKFERVLHNGVLVQENVEVTGPTRAAASGPEKAEGPLMLQGDHGPVAYRNVRIKRLP